MLYHVLTCCKPNPLRGLPKVNVAAVSRFADVINRVCSGILTRGLFPLELRLLNIEKPLLELCESGVHGDFGSL